MVHKAWDEASDYQDIKKKPYQAIKHPSQLSSLNIRQLKQLAMQINKHLGTTITLSLSAYLGHNKGKGRTLSNMRKADLIECIWYVRQVQKQRPIATGEWELDRMSDRIYQFTTSWGEAWVHYIACATEQKAYKLYKDLVARKLCTLISYRPGDRTHGEWELKVWGLDAEALCLLLSKDAPLTSVEEEAEPEVPERETLKQKCERYNCIISNGGPVGFNHVVNQLNSNPTAKGLVMSARGTVVVEDDF